MELRGGVSLRQQARGLVQPSRASEREPLNVWSRVPLGAAFVAAGLDTDFTQLQLNSGQLVEDREMGKRSLGARLSRCAPTQQLHHGAGEEKHKQANGQAEENETVG